MAEKIVNLSKGTTKRGPVGKSKLFKDKTFFDLRAHIRLLFSEGQIATVDATDITADTIVSSDISYTSGSTYYTGFIPAVASNNITAGTGGAIVVTNFLTTINTDAGGDAFTLADGVVKGQVKKIKLITDGGGDGVVTPANLAGGTTITFADAADYAILMWDGTEWVAIELGNDADGVTAPAIA